MSMIQFDRVTKRFDGGITAVNNLSFTIDKGELVFLAGHSGAGKSTLLNLVCGIERATHGKIVVKGYDMMALTARDLPFVRQHIGIVFQDHKLLFDRTVFDNVMLPLEIMGFNRHDARRRVQAALDKVGLPNREKSMPVTLSGGEQQRLCIARAVVSRPNILIADEPSANLDRSYALDIMELFKSFHQVGTTVLISAHDETLMENYGRRIIRLKEGQFAS
jgi:cell division transport system ATP-binding protein